jgi:nucleoid-associated protein YgaU
MAKKIRRKTKRLISISSENKTQNSFFSRLSESYTSLILGAIAVLIVAILIIAFVKGNNRMQTSSISDIAKVSQQINNNPSPSPVKATSSTYTVSAGDNLWKISKNFYGDGFKWVEIAKANNLQNPRKIRVGDKLTLPKINRTENIATKTETQKPTEVPTQKSTTEIVRTNSIIGNTYIVVRGDNLWNISVRAYGDGFKWVEIAKANNLQNPRIIHAGNKLMIPR